MATSKIRPTEISIIFWPASKTLVYIGSGLPTLAQNQAWLDKPVTHPASDKTLSAIGGVTQGLHLPLGKVAALQAFDLVLAAPVVVSPTIILSAFRTSACEEPLGTIPFSMMTCTNF